MRHVLLIGIDGLRIDDALAGDYAPALQAFVGSGQMAQVQMPVPTISGPGWSSILTGATHAQHAIVDNTFQPNNLIDHPDFMSTAFFADRSITTFTATGWLPLADPDGPSQPTPPLWWRAEAQAAGRHRVIMRDGEIYGYRWADEEITAGACTAIAHLGPRASFVYLGEIDEAGHLYGGIAPKYHQAVARVDAHLGTVVGQVESRVTDHPDEQWLVAVTTDHGHKDSGGHGGGEPVVTTSFLAARWIGGQAGKVPSQMAPQEIPAFLLEHLRG